ncbi:MAG: hypothetical protein IH851_08245 [Armatimonadetes bacterium]|nr:hypothetical protein [Armatimonadota bacterium]
MKPAGIVAALIGGAVGAVVWALIGWKTGYEVGFIAWGVGASVGFASYAAGGRGTANGVLCAVIALAAIFVGKVADYRLSLPDIVRAGFTDEVLSEHYYEELMQDAADFRQVASESEYPCFMVDHGYAGDAEDPSKVSPEKIEKFKAETVPKLREWAQNPPSYESWREVEAPAIEQAADAMVDAFVHSRSVAELSRSVVRDLGALDLLFAFLGLATAFRLASGGKRDGPDPSSEPASA